MKILVDMNLSPAWCIILAKHGYTAVHWSAIGSPRATDTEIMQYAQENEFIVFTHDLDFGTILATTKASVPSVLQLRAQDILPDTAEMIVVNALLQFANELKSGALITVDAIRIRARILPF
jgi:predicted nuclease of predicted toxin-antitoxin system